MTTCDKCGNKATLFTMNGWCVKCWEDWQRTQRQIKKEEEKERHLNKIRKEAREASYELLDRIEAFEASKAKSFTFKFHFDHGHEIRPLLNQLGYEGFKIQEKSIDRDYYEVCITKGDK